mgnify:CR=1 FL=1
MSERPWDNPETLRSRILLPSELDLGGLDNPAERFARARREVNVGLVSAHEGGGQLRIARDKLGADAFRVVVSELRAAGYVVADATDGSVIVDFPNPTEVVLPVAWPEGPPS